VSVCGQTSLEDTFESPSDLAESPDLYEILENLKARPLDLNKAGYEELVKVPWITPSMARNLIHHRTKNGPLEGPGELVGVPGFSSVVVDKILPYVRTGSPQRHLKREYSVRNRAAGHHPRREGYLGNHLRLYNRIIASIGDGLSLCALTEKDPYEGKYTDMLSLHARVVRDDVLRSVVVGDYWLAFAEGLVMGEARYMTKGSRSAKASERGIVPNRSSVECGWLRGAAANMKISSVDLYIFGSRLRLDASVNEDGEVTGIYTEGLHRTENELAKVGKLAESLVGARTVAAFRGLRVGLTGATARYRPAVVGSKGNTYSFGGSSYSVLGADLCVGLGATECFAELAKSVPMGEGYVVGMSYKKKGVDLGLLFRHYDENFYSPRSAGFGDSDNNNEEGAYLEAACRPAKGTRISGFMDLYRSLGPTFGSDYPTNGRELRLEIEQKLHRGLVITGRVFVSGRETFCEDEGFYFRERTGFRIQGDYRATRTATLRARFETVGASAEPDSARDRGSMLYWEAAFEPVSWARIRARFSVFQTDSWDARLYQHESDLPGVMRNVAVSGSGAMGYLLASVRPAAWHKVSAKFSWKKKDGEAEYALGIQSDIRLERE